MGTAVIGTILVVALTGGVGMMVEQSTVFPCELKQQISQDMATSMEVVSTDVVSESIQENGVYEAQKPSESMTLPGKMRLSLH